MNRSEPRSLLRIGELAAESGLPISTIRHYINEGLLGAPRKTSRNMAYYDRDSLSRIALIKSLQDELFLPLRLIKKLLDDYQELSPEDYNLILEIRARLAERHSDLLPAIASIPHSVVEKLELSEAELATLVEAGVVAPSTSTGETRYDEVDYRILSALSSVRASGLTGELATIEDLGLFIASLKQLAAIEARLFTKRISKNRPVEEIVELIRRALPAVNEVMSALHHKLLLEELTAMEKAAKPHDPN